MLNSDEFLKGNLTSSFYLNRKKNIPEVKREDKEKARSIIIFESYINAQIYLSSQNFTWDKPCINRDKSAVLDSAPDSHHRARLLAVTAPHAGDWLHALPISSCGLRLDDEAIRVAVGLRLGLNICQPHPCPCGTQVDARGTHGLNIN